MIVDDEIIFNVSNKNKKHLKSKGYDVSGKTVKIRTLDLPPNSHMTIRVKCDICGHEKELSFLKYNQNTKLNTTFYSCSQKCSKQKIINTFNEKYGYMNSSQHPDIKIKQSETNIKLYGGKSPHCNEKVKEKYYNTMIEKYGCEYPLQNEEIKQKFLLNIDETVKKATDTKIRLGKMVNPLFYNSFMEYRQIVNIETRKYTNELFDNWNGFDYYDKKYIKENLKLNYGNKNYPTIDHKISILNGFIDDISPRVIGNIKNLCITTRSNNSKKNSKNSL